MHILIGLLIVGFVVYLWLLGTAIASAVMTVFLALIGAAAGLVITCGAYGFNNVPGPAALMGAVLGLIIGAIVARVPVWCRRRRDGADYQRAYEMLYRPQAPRITG